MGRPWYVRSAAPGSRLARMPKAEATGLAPEQSVEAPLEAGIVERFLAARGAFPLKTDCLGERPERGFGHSKREARRAASARRSKSLCGPASAMAVGLLDGQPHRRGGPLPEALHPPAFATGIVVPAWRLARRRRRSRRRRPALSDLYVAAFIAGFERSVQPQFHPQALALHPGLHLLPRDLIPPASK